LLILKLRRQYIYKTINSIILINECPFQGESGYPGMPGAPGSKGERVSGIKVNIDKWYKGENR